ncbi:hypothetical protein GCM10025867_48690 (plasmid) [Frondihabitans sucicola]|uniref:Uncharacterized protein n=1 Tax=Frondihabitans sucicola TaxID=1268041 RepID=A0ABM8GVW9_9MICO|nr:hypothetical protein [Frondihabitans sucicola]BDZ52628.1 hypothetical protein GCM10025867_48690 [Frondihabitans sucicola]
MILKHAESIDGSTLVRDTERSKWQVITADGARTVKLGEAVTIAADWRHDGGTVTAGLMGANRFDTAYEAERLRRLKAARSLAAQDAKAA